MDLKKFIIDVPDWPEPGVTFRDITPLLSDAAAFKYTIDQLARPYKNNLPDLVVGIDARGFILASALAYTLGVGLTIIRKKGKLPRRTLAKEYRLEYATNSIEMHLDAISKGQRILLVDDVLATGGTMAAAVELIEELGGKILSIDFLISLDALGGKNKLKHPVRSLINY